LVVRVEQEAVMNCPSCGKPMRDGFLYVRGVGGSLFWSEDGGVRFPSRNGLDQLDLSRLSTTPTGAQGVLGAHRCDGCGMLAFGSR
jgi:uncharacterized C2H2 Zn-finger protein